VYAIKIFERKRNLRRQLRRVINAPRLNDDSTAPAYAGCGAGLFELQWE
jgi:hypothetical protein